ncbi:DEAD/DEAH box helicase [Epilithonimonas caeni]|uniref:DEAD/DEAH box helicase n=1 Tax=Epilithonimonas caeni TaxID=365343 RepID=UPI000686AF03|nr:DEAD/DEAH box helicase [Epilithonimonas caeni]
MQVVEFINEFHIKTDFGRWKDFQTQRVKAVCKVIEWSVSIFDGSYISKPAKIGNIVLNKTQMEEIGIPFQFSKDNKSIVFRKFESVATWNFKNKCWIIPIDYMVEVYNIGKHCKASHIKIGEQLPEEVDKIPVLPDLDFDVPLKKGEMRPYQKQGVARGLQLKKYINGDMPGLGKTLQSIATVYAAELKGELSFPCLVICPSALKINWQREFEMWTDKKAMVLDDKVKGTWHRFWEMQVADVFIVNYESLRKFFVRKYPTKDELKSAADIEMDSRIEMFNSVIIDEIHKLKNTASQRTKISLRITRGKNFIIGLTGTPVVNKPFDLIAQLAIISKLKRFGGLDGFKTRYCEGGSGASNLKELNYLLNSNCFFRREKHEVLKDLPAKMRQTINCEITNIDEYKKVERDFKKYLQESDISDAEIRKKLQSEVIVKITMLLQIAAKGKLEAAQEYIDEVLDSDQKIVVFCKHKAIVDELCKIYPQAVKVTGSENVEQKQNSVDMFQKNPKTNIIIGSHKAAGVGLTLTASSEVLFLELPWTFADLEQCEDRCHRMGQANSVRCTSLIAEGTLDNWLYNDVIMTKKQIADAVTGADDIVPVSMLDSIMNAFKK